MIVTQVESLDNLPAGPFTAKHPQWDYDGVTFRPLNDAARELVNVND